MRTYNSKRHIALAKELKDINIGRKQVCYKNSLIASALKVSMNTVINYIDGRVADGYLGEDILALLKKEKSL